MDVAGLCKGSTADSDSVCEGSNPSPAANEATNFGLQKRFCGHQKRRLKSLRFFCPVPHPASAPLLISMKIYRQRKEINMPISENVAEFIRRYKEENDLSISRSVRRTGHCQVRHRELSQRRLQSPGGYDGHDSGEVRGIPGRNDLRPTPGMGAGGGSRAGRQNLRRPAAGTEG